MAHAAIVLSALFWVLVLAVGFTYGVRAVISGQRLPPPSPRNPAGPRAAGLGAWIRETVLTLLTVAAWPVGVLPAAWVSDKGRGRTVLLVPGAWMTWTSCLPFHLWLRARRRDPVAMASYGPLGSAPRSAAGRLSARIRDVAEASGSDVAVVALGDAGRAAMRALELDPELPCDCLVTVCTPLRRPRLGVLLPGGAQRYDRDEEGNDLPWSRLPDLVIRSEGDNLVMADESLPDGSCPVRSLSSAGHLSCWYSPWTWRLALDAIDPPAEDPTPEAGPTE